MLRSSLFVRWQGVIQQLNYLSGKTMTSTAIEGGCLCGAVRYRVTGQSLARALCHCRSCRLASGAPSVAWTVFPARQFAIMLGEPNRYRSSPPVVRTFCGNCGTPLTYQHASRQDKIDVTTVTLDSPDDFPPTKEIWLEHKVAWERLNEGLEHYPRSSVPESSAAN
jgi:hypothetical protein